MDGTTGVLEFLEIQGSTDMVTKTEMLEDLRSWGHKISDRTLTYYVTEGLVPKAVRIGSRSAAYPKIVEEWMAWVLLGRSCGMSIDALRELAPLWRLLVRARGAGTIDLGEIELVARRFVMSSEANYMVPHMVSEVVGNLCAQCAQDIHWILKDGTDHSAAEQLQINFLLARQDEGEAQGRVFASTQLVLPGLDTKFDEHDPATIVLGIPVGVPLCAHTTRPVDLSQRNPHTADVTTAREEVTV